tara:strand:- start:505 stop:675 length:171 start_codon:yes stop_codon:yes gene_type:complete
MKRNSTLWITIGVLLILFSFFGTLFISLNKEYIYGFLIAIPAVIIGVLIIAWSLSE